MKSYYPDGVRDRDFPGYYDQTQEVEMTCEGCGELWVEDYESDLDGEVESYEDCEKCGGRGKGMFTFFEDRAEARAEARWRD